jgi:hypothetical protein
VRLATLSEEFMRARHIKIKRRNWIRENIRNHAKLQNYRVYAVRNPDGKVLAAAGVGSYGTYAFMDFRINRQNPHRASEYLDFMIIKTLKEQGVNYMERGRVVGSKLRNYKAKFPPIVEKEDFSTYTFDIPGVVRPPISWRVKRTSKLVTAAALLFGLAYVPLSLNVYYETKDAMGNIADVEEKCMVAKIQKKASVAWGDLNELGEKKDDLPNDEYMARLAMALSTLNALAEQQQIVEKKMQGLREEHGLPTDIKPIERVGFSVFCAAR